MTPVQCKMARAGLGWNVRDLAREAKVSPDTVVRFENDVPLRERTVDAMRAALEKAGIEFIPDNGTAEGVLLRKAQPKG